MTSLRWKSVYDSVMGTSHEKTGAPCQDACRVCCIDYAGEGYLIACVADGAGSASHSDRGAEIACDTFIASVQATLSAGVALVDFTRAIAESWLNAARAEVELGALGFGVNSRQLASTILGAVVGEHRSCFVQLGDGAIVIFNGQEYEAVFWPQCGEYAGTTNFLTDNDFRSEFEFTVKESSVEELAMFTDGLERLILRFSERDVHSAALEPLFRELRRADDADSLFMPLRAFLNSPRVNDRTDDDKTLVLATRLS